jgi:hypothetical protein
LAGPPAKKFAPPPRLALSAAVRKSGAPYRTTVKFDSTVQPGGGAIWEESGEPAPASAPG